MRCIYARCGVLGWSQAKAYSVPLLRMEERDDGLLSSLTDLSSHQLAVGSAPVNLITVFGQARQGKSTLMNQLLGQATFKVREVYGPVS